MVTAFLLAFDCYAPEFEDDLSWLTKSGAPYELCERVNYYCDRLGLRGDKETIIAMSFVETGWNKDLVGSRGEMGVLQVWPKYQKDFAKRLGDERPIGGWTSLDFQVGMGVAAFKAHKRRTETTFQAVARYNGSSRYARKVFRAREKLFGGRSGLLSKSLTGGRVSGK